MHGVLDSLLIFTQLYHQKNYSIRPLIPQLVASWLAAGRLLLVARWLVTSWLVAKWPLTAEHDKQLCFLLSQLDVQNHFILNSNLQIKQSFYLSCVKTEIVRNFLFIILFKWTFFQPINCSFIENWNTDSNIGSSVTRSFAGQYQTKHIAMEPK